MTTPSNPPPENDIVRLMITVDFIKRDLDELRERVREEFVSAREYKALTDLVQELRKSMVESLVETRKQFNDTLGDARRTLTSELAELRKLVEEKYVTKEEHSPVKNLAFGAVAIILMAVFGALVALVLK